MSELRAGSRFVARPEERRVLRFLENKRPGLVGPFLSAVPRARRATLSRLVSSMLREDAAGLASGSYEVDGPRRMLPLPGGERLEMQIAGSYAFGRLELEGPVLRAGPGGSERVHSAPEFLRLFRRKGLESFPESSWRNLERELENGSAYLALAYAHYKQKKGRLRELASECGARSVLDLALFLKARDPGFDDALFFERLCVEGHNLHPCARTRMGMEPEAVYRYAAEFDGEPEIRLVAVHRDRAEAASVDGRDPGEILFEHQPGLRQAVLGELEDRKLSPADYLLIPVHPWQLENVVPGVYREEIRRGVVVPIEGTSVPGSATASFRTLITGGQKRLAVKTSVNSQMTSTVRSISPNTAINAAEFTRLIREILRREPRLAPTFVPVCELAGISFGVDPAEPDTAAAKSRNLSAVLREDAGRYVRRGELAVAGCALYAESPVTGKPIVAELVEKFADSIGKISMEEAALRFVSEYARVILPGFLVLMVKYGVGLEGHLQNCVPVFRDGRPVRLLFRDWGGARIHTPRLGQCGLEVDFYPGSMILTDDGREMRNKVYYTVLQNHLGEIVLRVCKSFGVAESDLWREVRRICDGIFGDLECAEDAAASKAALYAAEVDHKALATMRLSPEKGGYKYARVPNPLSGPSGGSPRRAAPRSAPAAFAR